MVGSGAPSHDPPNACAPSADPSTPPAEPYPPPLPSLQGGLNTHLYGLPNIDPHPPAATNIYRLRYDGTTLQIAENVSHTTGLGLGVHTTINPRDAESYAVSDGQKDIWALFDRRTTEVKAAFRYDWVGNAGGDDLANNWIGGGTLRVTRIRPDKRTGKFDLLGTKAGARSGVGQGGCRGGARVARWRAAPAPAPTPPPPAMFTTGQQD